MGELWTTLVVAVAGPLGAVVILAAAALAAAGLAERINPTPDRPVDAQVREATERHERQERLDGRMRDAEQVRGKVPVDSTHVSFPVFGIVFLIWLVLTTWAGAIEHFEAPGRGLPLALALRPLWAAPLAALLAGAVAGSFYRRWYRRQSWQKRSAIEARRHAKERRDFESRIKSVRDAAFRRRQKHY